MFHWNCIKFRNYGLRLLLVIFLVLLFKMQIENVKNAKRQKIISSVNDIKKFDEQDWEIFFREKEISSFRG